MQRLDVLLPAQFQPSSETSVKEITHKKTLHGKFYDQEIQTNRFMVCTSPVFPALPSLSKKKEVGTEKLQLFFFKYLFHLQRLRSRERKIKD